MDGWQNYRFASGDEARFAGHGVGLLCGTIVGFDIDVRDAQLAQDIRARVEERLGAAPARIGNAPKVLLLYAVTGAPFSKLTSKSYVLRGDDPTAPDFKPHRIEVLAQGQQFVASGIHPDTGKPYTWNGRGDPLDVPVGLLPCASRSDFEDALRVAETMLASCGTPVGGERSRTRQQAGRDGSAKGHCANPAEFRAALEAIPNDGLMGYEEWRDVCFSVKSALGEAGRDDWLRWSGKSQRWGADARRSNEVWDSARPAITERHVYALAREHGWRPGAETERASWPDPISPFAEIAAAPFSADEFPDPIASYALLYSRRTGIDASICLTAALVACAAALADQFQIAADPSTHWYQQSRLWRLAIAPSGSGKSPADREMLRPLVELDRELRQEYDKAVRDLSEEDSKPPRPRLVVGETTIEALSEALRENPRGILIANDEFEGWFGGMDAYRKGAASRDRGEWLRTFDGGPHSIERIQRGSVYVENWGVSILTSTTPAALQKLTKQLPEDGLLQRFICVVGGRQRLEVDPGEQSHADAAYARYASTVQRLYALRPRAHGGIVSFSFDANVRFQSWRRENRALQEAVGAVDSALEAHVAKYPTLLLRLALVFHAAQIVNHDHPESRDPAAWPVPVDTLEIAIRFLRRAGQHAIALYLSRDGTSEAWPLAKSIARAILARPKEQIQRRDLVQWVRAFRGAENHEQDAALRILEDLGWLRSVEGAYAKAAPTHFLVNPGLAQKFTQLAEEERARRSVIREILTDSVAARRAGQGGVQ